MIMVANEAGYAEGVDGRGRPLIGLAVDPISGRLTAVPGIMMTSDVQEDE